ncbi:hypothetical protein [Streptosporangium sp. NPDC051022]|uniref:SCO7613 C-terminal domain-containing membrane protein n=1 Tax=Streptosporangium sp. NPDC051022 TaxID=3155752 RepID=UPI0034255467
MHDQSPVPGPRDPRPGVECPECGAPVAGMPDRCPRCELPLRGPVAAALWRLDGELAGLRIREADLLVRRGHMLRRLRAEGVPGDRAGWGAGGAHGDRESGTGQAAGAGQRVAGVRPAMAGAGPAVAGQGIARPGIAGPGGAGPGGAGPGGAGLPPSPPRRDFSPKAVQNLLLTLGGLLLVVAAVVFTVVSWGHIGIGGRAAILAGVTALAFATPKFLVRRGLGATAETIAMLGVALLFLDGYAARRVGLAGADGVEGFHYAALLFGLSALLVAGYSRTLPLRLPLPVAIVLAQFPLPLLAVDEAISWTTAAFTVTAAADVAFLAFVTRAGGLGTAIRNPADGAEVSEEATDGAATPGTPGTPGDPGAGEDPREAPKGAGVPVPGGGRVAGRVPWDVMIAGVCFGVTWMMGVLTGFLDSLGRSMDGPHVEDLAGGLVKGALLVALAAIGLVVAPRIEESRLRILTAGSMFALATGLAKPFSPLVSSGWWGVPYTVGALAAVAVALYLPGLNDPRVRSAGAVSAASLAGLTAVPFLPSVVTTLLVPFARLDGVWTGVPNVAEEWRTVPAASAPVVLGLLALASAVAARRGRPAKGLRTPLTGPRALTMGPLALAVGTTAVAVAPDAFAWGYQVELAVLLVLALVLVALLVPARTPRWEAPLTFAAVAVSAVAVVTALATRSGTYVALGVLLAVWGVATFAARVPRAGAAALVMAVSSGAGLVWAVTVGTRWQPVGDGLSLASALGALSATLLALGYRRRVTAEGEVAGDTPVGDASKEDVAAGTAAVDAVDGATGDAGGDSEGSSGGDAVEDGSEPGRTGGAGGAADPRWTAGLVAGAVLAAFALPPMAVPLARILGFYRPLVHPWTAQGASTERFPILVVVVVLLALAAVTGCRQVAGRKGALRAGLVAWPVALAALPVSVRLPYGLEVGLFVAGVGPAAWTAARSRTNWRFGAAAGLATASLALSWALAAEPATLAALPAVAVIAAATAFRGRERAVRVGGAGLAALLAGGEALAVGLALEWPVRYAAFGVLAVACAAAAVAGGFRRSSFAIGVETAGYVLAAVGLALTAGSLSMAAVGCAVAGVLMAGTALRPDRRRAGYVATGLLLMASWLRLLASDITVVEAYTVPFSLVLLAFGWWRARRAAMSSWAAYGSGLASSLLPSMIAMLTGEGWLRPLLLGGVCLAVLLAGARFRLQAPALLGGLVLAAVALHELAPWITRVVMEVPRWVPMAFGGLLLVVVGATYEARLRDVRRLRAAVGRMR